MFEQLGLIGCGLMGGSFALALKRAGLVKRVVGYSKSPSTTERARAAGRDRRRGALGAAGRVGRRPRADRGAGRRPPKPPSRRSATWSSPTMLVMDVGSTKGDVIEAARRGLRTSSAPSCPRTRSPARKSSGVEHADADLYHGRQVVLTPIKAHAALATCKRATQVWTGARRQGACTMTPEAHDAPSPPSATCRTCWPSPSSTPSPASRRASDFLALAGPGFRDFTRIAASDPTMWRDVLLANREQVLLQSQAFQRQPAAARSADRSRQRARRSKTPIDAGQPARAPVAAWAASSLAGLPRCSPPPSSTSRRSTSAAGTVAPARLQEHLQPRAAAGRAGQRHDGRPRPARFRRHARDAGCPGARWAAASSATAATLRIDRPRRPAARRRRPRCSWATPAPPCAR